MSYTPEKAREYSRQWRAENAEQHAEVGRKWRAENRDRINARQRENYRKRHPKKAKVEKPAKLPKPPKPTPDPVAVAMRSREVHREWYRKNRERVLAQRNTPEAKEKTRRYSAEHRLRTGPKPNTESSKVSRRKHALAKKYGMTIDQYEAMLTEQGGVCGICGGTDSRRALAVDHVHGSEDPATGQVERRGLLCSDCNKGIGYYRDRPDLLRKVVEYLRRHCEGCGHG